MVFQYVVLKWAVDNTLDSQVEYHLSDGWIPVGGVSVAKYNGAPYCFQAMMKKIDNKIL